MEKGQLASAYTVHLPVSLVIMAYNKIEANEIYDIFFNIYLEDIS